MDACTCTPLTLFRAGYYQAENQLTLYDFVKSETGKRGKEKENERDRGVRVTVHRPRALLRRNPNQIKENAITSLNNGGGVRVGQIDRGDCMQTGMYVVNYPIWWWLLVCGSMPSRREKGGNQRLRSVGNELLSV